MKKKIIAIALAMTSAAPAFAAPRYDRNLEAAAQRALAERIGDLTLAFAPSVRLLRSPWPIHGIWRFNTEDNAPQPPHHAQDILVTRPDYDPVPRLLPPGGAALILALARGDRLGHAVGAATAEAPGFDLSPLLSLLMQDNALARAQLKDPA